MKKPTHTLSDEKPCTGFVYILTNLSHNGRTLWEIRLANEKPIKTSPL